MNKLNVPTLHFPEFSEDWEEKKISEIANVTTGNKDTKDREENGLYPFFVRSDNVERINSYAFDGEAVLTSGDGVGVGKNFHYINGKFNYHQRVYSINNFIKDVSGKFFYYYFSNVFYNHVIKLSAKNSVDSVRRSMITELSIGLPTLSEQQKIASFLTAIDTKIELLTRKKDLLEQYKKGVMQQLFSQKIRFKDENGEDFPEWEEKELNQISNKVTQKNKDSVITKVLTNSATQGIVNQQDYFDKDIANQDNLQGYFIVNENDFVYNPRISVFAPVGPIKRNKIGVGVMSPLYTIFRFFSVDLKYLEYYFETSNWHEFLKSVANTGARHDRMNITNESFFRMPIPVPCKNEQQKIATFLSKIDGKLEQVSKFLEFTKNYKKGLLQQLFV